MRVISQNGTWDMPYDNTSFRIEDGLIQADLPTGKMIMVAEYETNERAMKEMSAMHKFSNVGSTSFQFR